MYNIKDQGKPRTENWHFDKYRGEHEFPAMNFSSDEEAETSEIGNESSSAHLSGKIPKVSDEEFKKLFQLRNERKRSGMSNTSNPLSNVPNLVFKDKSNLLNLKEDDNKQRLDVPQNVETKENILLSSSTPKFNGIVTDDVKITGSSPADRNLVDLLSSTNLRDEVGASQFSKMLEKIEHQASKINELQTQLQKSEIREKNAKLEVMKLQHEVSQLTTSNIRLEQENDIVKNNFAQIQKGYSELQQKTMDMEHEVLIHSENSEKWKLEVTKEKMASRKEREIHNSMVSDLEDELTELNKVNKNIGEKLNTLNVERNELETKNETLKSEILRLTDELKELADKKIGTDLNNDEKLKVEHERFQKLQNKYNEVSSKYEATSLDFSVIKEENEELKKQKIELGSKLDELNGQQKETSFEIVKMRTELVTKLEITTAELTKVNSEKTKLQEIQTVLEKEVNETKRQCDQLKERLGKDPISQSRLGSHYKLLEMDQIYNLSLTELQNIVINILKSFNIKFSDLKQDVVFIRDEIFAFFTEIHSILHSYESKNKIIIDRSVKLDLSDRERFRACMEILLKDIKKLKGLE